jgi:hypothetical protein
LIPFVPLWWSISWLWLSAAWPCLSRAIPGTDSSKSAS